MPLCIFLTQCCVDIDAKASFDLCIFGQTTNNGEKPVLTTKEI